MQKNSSLLVNGPASIGLVSGEASCLGAPMTTEFCLTVKEDRRLPVETTSHATLDVRFSKGGSATRVEGSPFPVGWGEAAQLVRQSRGTVAILGDVDSGKSTLSAVLANECFKDGLSVGVIDADIGQADIGPPATISFSHVSQYIISLQELTPERAFFIGDTSPSLVSEKLFNNITRIIRDPSTAADVLLVNTDGWVRADEAVRYKIDLLHNIDPDFILAIASEKELDPLLELQQSTTLKLERPAHAKTRSREERKRAREAGYRRFLRDAERIEYRLGAIKLRRFDAFKQLKLWPDGSLNGVLAGLLDEEEWLLSIGRIERLRDDSITVSSRLQGHAKIIELGAIVLSSSYEEVGFET